MPPDEAIAIAVQIAEALEAAHDKGVIHRDLKPANIKVTPEAQVKVLDFGLAKALDSDPETTSQDLTQSPTLSMSATRAGMILGTAAHMSPEQAKGRPVDRRTDIWAFGAVLYEMLTGRRAFEGEDVSETLAAVLRDPVEFDALPADVPANVAHLIERCLTRELRDRLGAISEARYQLERPKRQQPVGLDESRPGAGPVRVILATAAGIVAVVWGLMWAAGWGSGDRASGPLMALELELDPPRRNQQCGTGRYFA